MKRILVLLLVVLFVGGLVLIRTNKKPDVANETMVFTMAINTHSGSLDYDWTKIVNTNNDVDGATENYVWKVK